MIATIFKTHLNGAEDVFCYWMDELPDHYMYDVIDGQSIYNGEERDLELCYELGEKI